jgi:hypothetical protein
MRRALRFSDCRNFYARARNEAHETFYLAAQTSFDVEEEPSVANRDSQGRYQPCRYRKWT